jgi:hypothetical protein
MWEHPDIEKRWTSTTSRKIIGFWRECVLCARGSTDLKDDPNYVPMTVVAPLPKKLRYLMKGKVYDKYWVICDSCFPTYIEKVFHDKKKKDSAHARATSGNDGFC